MRNFITCSQLCLCVISWLLIKYEGFNKDFLDFQIFCNICLVVEDLKISKPTCRRPVDHVKYSYPKKYIPNEKNRNF